MEVEDMTTSLNAGSPVGASARAGRWTKEGLG